MGLNDGHGWPNCRVSSPMYPRTQIVALAAAVLGGVGTWAAHTLQPVSWHSPPRLRCLRHLRAENDGRGRRNCSGRRTGSSYRGSSSSLRWWFTTLLTQPGHSLPCELYFLRSWSLYPCKSCLQIDLNKFLPRLFLLLQEIAAMGSGLSKFDQKKIFLCIFIYQP